jgi:hypothetical protein
MPAGRPPKPVELKKRQGTYRVDRDQSRGNLAPVPAIGADVTEFSPAVALDSVLTAGVHWIAATDAPKVCLLREAMEDYARLRAAGASAKDVREARAEVAKLLSELGFDPTARAKLGLAEVKAQSKLEELRSRRGARSDVVAAEVADGG